MLIMARSLDEIRKLLIFKGKWAIFEHNTGFILFEQIDYKADTYPTPLFFINSINICRELIEDINLN